ncbi:hypothetical protein J2Z50_002555 [Ensifer mexicanus]|nr:hypothetical protein [Sinorhizobium mexicanum]
MDLTDEYLRTPTTPGVRSQRTCDEETFSYHRCEQGHRPRLGEPLANPGHDVFGVARNPVEGFPGHLFTATVIASGIGGFPAISEAVRTADQCGVRRLSLFTVSSFLMNLAAGQVSIRHGFKGPIGAPVTACAAGVQAIGDAARLIRANEADIAICGGTEACINSVSLGGAYAISNGFGFGGVNASVLFRRWAG